MHIIQRQLSKDEAHFFETKCIVPGSKIVHGRFLAQKWCGLRPIKCMKNQYLVGSTTSFAARIAPCLLLAASLAAQAATEEQINKKFTVQPGGTVVVDVDSGSINVRTNAGSEVVVDVWRKVGRSSKSEEEKYL